MHTHTVQCTPTRYVMSGYSITYIHTQIPVPWSGLIERVEAVRVQLLRRLNVPVDITHLLHCCCACPQPVEHKCRRNIPVHCMSTRAGNASSGRGRRSFCRLMGKKVGLPQRCHVHIGEVPALVKCWAFVASICTELWLTAAGSNARRTLNTCAWAFSRDSGTTA